MPRMPSMGFRPEQMPIIGGVGGAMTMMPGPHHHQLPQGPPPPLDNLLKLYLNQEGIDRRYSHLILRELKGATELTDDQLNQAANELISTTSSNSGGDQNQQYSPDYNNSNV